MFVYIIVPIGHPQQPPNLSSISKLKSIYAIRKALGRTPHPQTRAGRTRTETVDAPRGVWRGRHGGPGHLGGRIHGAVHTTSSAAETTAPNRAHPIAIDCNHPIVYDQVVDNLCRVFGQAPASRGLDARPPTGHGHRHPSDRLLSGDGSRRGEAPARRHASRLSNLPRSPVTREGDKQISDQIT
jgi:hypothetical protein